MGIRSLTDGLQPWFIKRINTHLMEGATKESPVGYFRPSMFSMMTSPEDLCFRELFYGYLGVGEATSFDISSMRRMIAGTAHHIMWEDIFREAGIKTISGGYMRMAGDSIYTKQRGEKNWKLVRKDEGADYPDIHGMCDWTIFKDENSEPELIEWKSGNASKPKWGHKIQWSIYAVMTNVRKGWIVLEPRDSAEPNPFKIERDDELMRFLFSGLRNIEKSCKQKIAVPKDERCTSGKWKAERCPQYNLCYSEAGDAPWI